MFIVDGVMAFYTSGSNGDPKRGFAGYLSYTPVWQRYLSGNSSNCIQSAGSCPCLDQGAPCVKQGNRLQNMPDEVSSWYSNELFKVSSTLSLIPPMTLYQWPAHVACLAGCAVVMVKSVPDLRVDVFP